ncbi:hypothetical protein MNBD_CHLOROFLEXI01-985 [hydrothermal vent metagenome]|uniref:Leucine-binding protein domain-containing protein n=1 Tax=hydrothermal vent metagenome TaxID=652676 RepID=A0A3B0URE5_9ZZZZ
MVLNNAFTKLRRRRYFIGVAGRWATFALISMVTLSWLLLAAPPAFAHEFKIGILLASGEDEDAFMDGFQLAVDQSPDVSHPPGEDAGDHLGGLDVEMIVVEDARQPDTAQPAALDLIEQQEVAIIIADLPAAAVEAIFDPVTQSETLLIATSGTDGIALPATPYFFEQEDVNGRFPQSNEAFTTAFRAAYGQAPATAAARGYLAARLIDIAVEATGGDFANEQAFHDALLEASQALVGSVQVEERPLATIPATVGGSQPPAAPPIGESDQEPEALSPTSAATLEADQTPTPSVESIVASEDANPTFAGTGWIIAVGIVLIVGAALVYLRRG